MQFSLIICTYQRTRSLLNLLNSVLEQSLYPNEILIIDGSIDDKTKDVLSEQNFGHVIYYKVSPEHRGLTRQRNFGISKVSHDSEIVCFLDDDVILERDYFKQLIGTYKSEQNAMGVGGYISNEVSWKLGSKESNSYFSYDDWYRKEPLRFRVRQFFGLEPDRAPGYLPNFSHGRSISFLPPSGRVYQVEQLMGGVSSFKKELFERFKFSSYFEGYGLYEDADFTLRVSKEHELYVNTSAKLSHFHDTSGRPNKYNYGKMVARNGWYVWRVKYPKPSLRVRFKWHLTSILLMKLRFLNVLTGPNRREAFTEGIGRLIGWLSLFIGPPKIETD